MRCASVVASMAPGQSHPESTGKERKHRLSSDDLALGLPRRVRQIRGPLRLQRLGPCARCAIVDVAQGQGKRPEAQAEHGEQAASSHTRNKP